MDQENLHVVCTTEKNTMNVIQKKLHGPPGKLIRRPAILISDSVLH